jgi:hypothetical protein
MRRTEIVVLLLLMSVLLAVLTASLAPGILAMYPPAEFTAASGARAALGLGVGPMQGSALFAIGAIAASNRNQVVVIAAVAILILGVATIAVGGAWTVSRLDPNDF